MRTAVCEYAWRSGKREGGCDVRYSSKVASMIATIHVPAVRCRMRLLNPSRAQQTRTEEYMGELKLDLKLGGQSFTSKGKPNPIVRNSAKQTHLMHGANADYRHHQRTCTPCCVCTNVLEFSLPNALPGDLSCPLMPTHHDPYAVRPSVRIITSHKTPSRSSPRKECFTKV